MAKRKATKSKEPKNATKNGVRRGLTNMTTVAAPARYLKAARVIAKKWGIVTNRGRFSGNGNLSGIIEGVGSGNVLFIPLPADISVETLQEQLVKAVGITNIARNARRQPLLPDNLSFTLMVEQEAAEQQ